MKASLALLAIATLGAAAPSAPVDMAPVRAELRKLITAEEVYFSDHNGYTSNISLLRMTPSDSVSLKFTEFSTNAYAVAGTLKGVSGVSCVTMIGRVATAPRTAKGTAAEAEGGVTCDE